MLWLRHADDGVGANVRELVLRPVEIICAPHMETHLKPGVQQGMEIWALCHVMHDSMCRTTRGHWTMLCTLDGDGTCCMCCRVSQNYKCLRVDAIATVGTTALDRHLDYKINSKWKLNIILDQAGNYSNSLKIADETLELLKLKSSKLKPKLNVLQRYHWHLRPFKSHSL